MPRVLALLTAPPLVILSYIFSPVIWLLNKASNLTLWVMGLGHTNTSELAHSEEELRLIVAESVAGGHLSRNERMMIENVLNLEEKTAHRVMVPRPGVTSCFLESVAEPPGREPASWPARRGTRYPRSARTT